jgi:GntR family transcriptional repressor for pyruvate dehydrogenase complex
MAAEGASTGEGATVSRAGGVLATGVVAAGELAVNRIRPAYEQVADQIRDLILSKRLVPGDRLPNEGKLSTTFGVSRSTVREALRVLSAQDLVYTSRGVSGGTFVADTKPSAITAYLENGLSLLSGTDALTTAELLEAREMFEVPATRLAALRATPDDISAMRLAIKQEAAAVDRSTRFERNSHFHVLMLAAGKNRLAEVFVTPIFSVIRARFVRDDAPPRFWRQIDTDHETILAHVEKGAADEAAEAMRAHLARLRKTYTQWPPRQ